MEQRDPDHLGGFPVLVLIGLATVLAWAFSNPFVGWMVVFAGGLGVLASVDFVRRRWRHHP